MHISRASFLLSLAAIPVSNAIPQVTEPKYLDPEHYRVDEFIRVAITLQSLGRETAIKRPLCPIELIDGTPFLIVAGYILGGYPESDESYLRYAEANCDWSGARYGLITDQQKRFALAKLLASNKWKTATDTSERQRLSSSEIAESLADGVSPARR